jgi:putative transcriptional regulator
MTVTRHPSDVALAAFASATVDEGRSLVLATHLSFCPTCRKAVRTLEHVGGALLDHTDPAALQEGALERALMRIGEVEAVIEPARGAASIDALPAPLSGYALGPWRWIGRGLRWRSVDLPTEPSDRVLLLDAAPGTRLHRHRHSGTEWVCVLEGAFRDDMGRCGAGDFDEVDDTVEHAPTAEYGPHCVCIIALNGNFELQGWLGWLLQPFLRF